MSFNAALRSEIGILSITQTSDSYPCFNAALRSEIGISKSVNKLRLIFCFNAALRSEIGINELFILCNRCTEFQCRVTQRNRNKKQ